MKPPSLAESLEFRREQYGLTRLEWCAKLGIYPSHYSEIMKGKRKLPLRATKRAYALGVPAKVLLAEDKRGER